MCQDKTHLSKHQTRINEVIAEARSWLKTPYQHQAMLKGVGVDCVGLVVAVGLATGVLDITPQQIARYAGYGRLPNPRKMGEYMRKHLIPVTDPQPGDIMWIQWRHDLPMHLAIITNAGMIHAFSDPKEVVEHRINQQWRNRVNSYWRYPRLN